MNIKLKKLIQKSRKILITSHISPDPDAECSALAVYYVLKQLYPEKQIRVSLYPQKLPNLEFLSGHNKIEEVDLGCILHEFNPDILIFLDNNNYSMFSKNPDLIRELAEKSKLILIDHHYRNEVDPQFIKADLEINSGRSSTCEEIYFSFVKDAEEAKVLDQKLADILLLGILSDTGRFLYSNAYLGDTFATTLALVDSGASIGRLTEKLLRMSPYELIIHSELNRNVVFKDDFMYTFISDKFYNLNIKDKIDNATYKKACHSWISVYLGNVGNALWGFVVTKDESVYKNMYSVSLRAVPDYKDVSKIALKFGGGGHKNAAGFKIESNGVDTVLRKITDKIKMLEV